MHQREPTLDELLNEPMIRKVMAADGYSAEDIRLLLRQANAARTQAIIGSRGLLRSHELHGSDTCPFPR